MAVLSRRWYYRFWRVTGFQECYSLLASQAGMARAGNSMVPRDSGENTENMQEWFIKAVPLRELE
jgi:hypothetical protein